MAPSRSTRSWPPLAATGVAFLLVFIVLPNPLRVPQNNPTASAEYAPVPGRQESSRDANFGEVGEGSSAGLGFGGEGEGLLPGELPPPPPAQYRPRQKNCVGDPPRQTEDPLSPPCVPFFQGDNGGATWDGVTRDEIKISMYNDWGIKGDMNRPWQPSDESADHQSDFNETYIVRTVKAHLRYFQSHFQTYGRVVHVFGQPSTSAACASRRGDAIETRIGIKPFASIHQGNSAGGCYVEQLAEYGIPSMGINWDSPRQGYYERPGYAWGFYPDQETEARYSASFICRKLAGGTARFTHDATLEGNRRTFGFVRLRQDATGVYTRLAELLVRYLDDECGFSFDDQQYYDGAGAGPAPTIMQRFKRLGITTVVCYCSAYPGQAMTQMQNAATAVGYFPEWYFDQGGRGFRAIWQQTATSKAQPPGFGVTHFWRGAAFREQYHYRAFKEVDPDGVPNTRFNFDIYHMFFNLFEAVQAAGPTLTPDSVKRGMFTFHFLDRKDPFVPLGGYGPYNSKAVSDYTFVDTGMGWWWDPTGTPPGGSKGEGCIRVLNEGRRYYAGEWRRGDADLFADGAPCTQDNTEIDDPQPSDL